MDETRWLSASTPRPCNRSRLACRPFENLRDLYDHLPTTYHLSRITSHPSPITHHVSPLTPSQIRESLRKPHHDDARLLIDRLDQVLGQGNEQLPTVMPDDRHKLLREFFGSKDRQDQA